MRLYRTSPIDISSAGNNVVIPASEYYIKIITIILTVAGEVDIIFKKGEFPISGTMHFGGVDEPKGMVINNVDCPIIIGANTPFIIYTSTNNYVGGMIIYYLEGSVMDWNP